MTIFNDRDQAFEKKFAHDQEAAFKAVARRNKLLGLWAADKLGLSGDARDAYAKEVVVADFEAPGDDDVVGKVLTDLTAAGVAVDEKEIRQEMLRLLSVAKEQLLAE